MEINRYKFKKSPTWPKMLTFFNYNKQNRAHSILAFHTKFGPYKYIFLNKISNQFINVKHKK